MSKRKKYFRIIYNLLEKPEDWPAQKRLKVCHDWVTEYKQHNDHIIFKSILIDRNKTEKLIKMSEIKNLKIEKYIPKIKKHKKTKNFEITLKKIWNDTYSVGAYKFKYGREHLVRAITFSKYKSALIDYNKTIKELKRVIKAQQK